MPLMDNIAENAQAVIEEMKKNGAEEMPVPDSPLLVVKCKVAKEGDMPLARFGEYVVVQRGL